MAHVFNRNIDPLYPASLSRSTVNGLLREELGWQGVVMTDDLQMGAVANHYSLAEIIKLTVNAGVDVLIFGNNLDWDPDLAHKAYLTLMQLVREGAISSQRIERSWQRLEHMKQQLR